MISKLNINSKEMAEIKKALDYSINEAIQTVKDGATATINLKIDLMSFDDYSDLYLPEEKTISNIKYQITVIQKKEVERSKGKLSRIEMKNIDGVLVPCTPQISLAEVFDGIESIEVGNA